jgi:exopolysaccharide biosynthesis polyprenyl glycosylphosphotransferase
MGIRTDSTNGSAAVGLGSESMFGAGVAKRPAARLPHGRTWLLVGGDIIALCSALVVAYIVGNKVAPPAVWGPTWLLILLAVLAIPVWVAVLAIYGLYERQSKSIAPATLAELADLFHALLASSLIFLFVGQAVPLLTDAFVYSAGEATIFVGAGLPLVLGIRGALRAWVFPMIMAPRRALIVGAGDVGRMVERKLRSHPEYGIELVGFVDEDAAEGAGAELVGRPADLTQLVDDLKIDWVILAFSRSSYEETLDLVRNSRRPDVHMTIVPRFFEVFASNARIEELEGMPVVSLPSMRFSRTVLLIKRAVDIVASAAGLIVLSPLMLVAAIAIKLESRGPIFFRQERHGRGGSTFRIVKFRTMCDGAEKQRATLASQNEVDGVLFKIKTDPRITRVGKILRPTSIDELPQLWNVLRGEMSLVGPRPFVVHESNQITGWAGRRLDITPGITGLWQVLGRNDMPFEEMVKLDYIYVTNWSLWWDVKILFQTIPVVLGRKGAY